MYVKKDEQLKSIKIIKLTSDRAITLIFTKTETGIRVVLKCPSDSSNPYPFRNLTSSKISSLRDFVCGKKDFLNQMTLILFNIYDQYQIIVNLTFKNTTNVYKTMIESNSDEQMSFFICTQGASQNSINFARFKNPKPVVIKNHDRKS